MNKCKSPFLLWLSVVLVCVLSACIDKRDLQENTVIVHILAEPKGLHPTNNNDAYQKMIFQCTQKRLVMMDLASGKMTPDVLESFPELLSDSLTYKCKIRSGIRWDDGSNLSVADIVFSIKAIVCPGVNNPDIKSIFKNLEDVVEDPIDKQVFYVKMKERYFDNSSMLSYVIVLQEKEWDPTSILKKQSFSVLFGDQVSVEDRPILDQFISSFNHSDKSRVPKFLKGLGPYQVTDWQTGSSITLTRKSNWWGKSSDRLSEKEFPERIIFRVIREMESVVLALKREEIDITSELSAAAMIRLQEKAYFNRNYKTDYVGSFSYTYMGMNMRPENGRLPYFTDRRVRRAMAHVLPVDEIIAVIAKGKANRIAGFIQPGQVEYDKNLRLIDYNLEQARNLLEESGWKDSDGDNIRDKIIDGKRVPFSFGLSYMISPVTTEMVRMIKSEFYKAGLEVRPEPMEFSVFYQNAFAHQFDAMLGSWSSSALPEDPRQIWHTESWASGGSNFVGFGSTYSDSLIETANRELNPAVRKEMLQDIQRVIYEEQPYVFLFNATRKVAAHKRFKNISFHVERPHLQLNNLELDPNWQSNSPD
jgi:ABC-type transport system substrate-binding protein